MKKVTITVNKDDYVKLMGACKEGFLKAHPEMKGIPLKTPKMFYEVVRFYME